MTIQEHYLQQLIYDKAVRSQKELIKRIDEELQLIHQIITGKSLLLESRYSSKNEADHRYIELIELRQKANVTVEEFVKLDIDIFGKEYYDVFNIRKLTFMAFNSI